MGGSRGSTGRSRNCERKVFREFGLRRIIARLFPRVCCAPVKYHGIPCDDVLNWRIWVWPFKLKPIARGLLIQRRKFRRELTVVVDELRVHRPAIGVRSYGRVTGRDLFQKCFRMICSRHLSLRYDPSSWVGMWLTLYRKGPVRSPGAFPESSWNQWPVTGNRFRASNCRFCRQLPHRSQWAAPLMIVHFAYSVIAELDESLAGHEQHHQPHDHAAEASHIGSYIDRLAETF